MFHRRQGRAQQPHADLGLHIAAYPATGKTAFQQTAQQFFRIEHGVIPFKWGRP
jgi:hypothetical protein